MVPKKRRILSPVFTLIILLGMSLPAHASLWDSVRALSSWFFNKNESTNTTIAKVTFSSVGIGLAGYLCYRFFKNYGNKQQKKTNNLLPQTESKQSLFNSTAMQPKNNFLAHTDPNPFDCKLKETDEKMRQEFLAQHKPEQTMVLPGVIHSGNPPYHQANPLKCTDQQIIACMIQGYKDVALLNYKQLLTSLKNLLPRVGINVIQQDDQGAIFYTPQGKIKAHLLHRAYEERSANFYLSGLLLGYEEQHIKAFYRRLNERNNDHSFDEDKKISLEWLGKIKDLPLLYQITSDQIIHKSSTPHNALISAAALAQRIRTNTEITGAYINAFFRQKYSSCRGPDYARIIAHD